MQGASTAPAAASAARAPLPPGSDGLPLIGETIDFLRSPSRFSSERFERYGGVFYARVLGKPTVFFNSAEANHWIFAGEGRYLENEWSSAVRKLLGARSLSLISGEAHRARRKLLAPHFKRTAMAGVVAPMDMVVRRHLRRWQTDAALGPIAVVPHMRALAFEVAATYLLGETADLGVSLEDLSRDFETWTKGMFVLAPVAVPQTRFGRAMAARGRLMTAIDDLVMRRDAEDRRGVDVLSTLLDVRDEAGELLPRDVIVDELQLLLFAGHDTTVTATANAIYHLAQRPELRARARAEQDGLTDRRMSLETLRAMPLLEAIIKESMRLIPPIAGAFRVMLEDAEFGGYRIPKGWRVAVGVGGVHGRADYYDSPARFDPDRWLDGRCEDLPPFAYIPFGGGPRSCLGMHFAQLEMHMVLAQLLRDFDWSLVPGQDLRFREVPLPLPRSGLIIALGYLHG
ncbi:cytochrome P450 [Pseudenhygromyxa sp. WMMC2535]|uniref:cytochrome P450 n=1 Tax=Pseudenhygromyxa sp. WMMC2535 TaxID=2712867 RepID=UPI001556AD38|nr:cytochrome P450 [Pseudenhygromyxa sp. WMMC2535]NVB36278.1 cytochrome P450 [Pseudenhygromyxa sp. WMMC2535]